MGESIRCVCSLSETDLSGVGRADQQIGELAVIKLLKRLQVHDVEMPEAYEQCFRNVNTPEEYEKLKEDGKQR